MIKKTYKRISYLSVFALVFLFSFLVSKDKDGKLTKDTNTAKASHSWYSSWYSSGWSGGSDSDGGGASTGWGGDWSTGSGGPLGSSSGTVGTSWGGDSDGDGGGDDDGDTGCFKALAKILMSDGLTKFLKDVVPGDKVLGKGGGIFEVKGLIAHDGKSYHKNNFKTNPLVKAVLSDGSFFEYVKSHPIYVFKENKLSIKRILEVGDILVNHEGKKLTILSLQEDIKFSKAVYELDLGGLRNPDKNPSYFVDGILVDEWTLTRKENNAIFNKKNNSVSSSFVRSFFQKV